MTMQVATDFLSSHLLCFSICTVLYKLLEDCNFIWSRAVSQNASALKYQQIHSKSYTREVEMAYVITIAISAWAFIWENHNIIVSLCFQ